MSRKSCTRKRRQKINKFILNAALKKKPVFKSYKKLVLNWEEINYADFEWKYYQHYHGNRNLTIERSPDNSSPLTFSDLPMDVLKKVVEKSALADCLSLRKVSRDLRTLVDSTEVRCEMICFHFWDTSSEIELEHTQVTYDESGASCYKYDNYDILEIEDTRKYPEIMAADAASFLKNPKLKIDHLKCEIYGDGALSEFFESLKSLDSQLDVRSLYIDTTGGIVPPILPFLKSKNLEEISVRIYDVPLDKFNEIAETEQWKTAKKLHWNWLLDGFQMEKLLHFEEIEIDQFDFSDENLAMVRDVLLKSVHIQVCILKTFYYLPANLLLAKIKTDRIMSQNSAFNVETGRFSIPNSSEYFQLEFNKSQDIVEFDSSEDRVQLMITRISEN